VLTVRATVLTEGDARRGAGHLMRSRVLAEELQAAGAQVTVLAECDDARAALLAGLPHRRVAWGGQAATTLAAGADLLVVDSYRVDAAWCAAALQACRHTAFFDDTLRLPYDGGIVINTALGAELLPYPRDGGCRYLLGAQYAPLRREFRRLPAREVRTEVRRLLLLAGGGAAEPYFIRLGSELAELLAPVEIRTVGFSAAGCTGLPYLTAAALRDEMLAADIAVTAGGQTLYELAAAGVPAVVLATADNQRSNIDGFVRAGLAADTGVRPAAAAVAAQVQALDAATRADRARRARALIDGDGAIRLARALLDLAA
jgi:UDP-2,4-diacetamido-2,4,6-trideoxy-beta-L-altropyranose hydrolase